MKHLPFRSTLLLAGFFCTLCLTLPATADGAAPTPLAQTLTGEAKAAYESARLLFEDGDSRGALAKFSYSYDLSHDTRLLWNMAACEKELRHYAKAATLIDRYLRDGLNAITTDQRQSAVETQTALRAFYANVRLVGAPQGATVFIDGDLVGRLPLSEPLLVDLGTRTLRVEHPDFEPSETKLEVVGGGELEAKVKLQHLAPPYGAVAARLTIISSGAKDIVAIDGKVVAAHRWEGALAPGEHVVRVTAADKSPYESRVRLLAGSTRTVRVTLDDENHRASIWPWLAGGAAVAAGAVVGGYFLLKSDDRPGGHPEGKLATIYVSLRTAQ
jgi:hypothetical protein